MDRFKPTSRRAALCAAIVLVAAANPGLAGWPANGTPLSGPTPVQGFQTAVASDGALLVLRDILLPSSIARLTTGGATVPGWPVAVAGSGYVDGLAPDLLGGCYYALSNPGVYIHHLRADGSADPAWPANGVLLCDAPGYKHAQIAADPGGGVYVVWADGRDSPGLPRALFASRVLPDGTVAAGWDAGGTRLATVPDTTNISLGFSRDDGVGGLYALEARTVHFGLPEQSFEEFLVHLSPNGPSPSWPSGGFFPPGVPLGTGFTFDHDGAGGVFVNWNVGESGFVQRFDTTGNVAAGWPPEGHRVVADTGVGCLTGGILADGNGGVLFPMIAGPPGDYGSWLNYVSGLDGTGAALSGWPAPGVEFPANVFSVGWLATDGAAGCYLEWGNVDPTTYFLSDLRVLRVRSNGTMAPGFPDSGLVVCAGPGVRYQPALVPDGRGGVYAVWLDSRNHTPANAYDVYATRVGPSGDALASVAAPPPAANSLVASPNPFTSAVSFEIAAGGARDSRLDIFDAAGRRVRTLGGGAGSTGRVQWNGLDDAGRVVPPGLYLVRTHAGASVRVVRVL